METDYKKSLILGVIGGMVVWSGGITYTLFGEGILGIIMFGLTVLFLTLLFLCILKNKKPQNNKRL